MAVAPTAAGLALPGWRSSTCKKAPPQRRFSKSWALPRRLLTTMPLRFRGAERKAALARTRCWVRARLEPAMFDTHAIARSLTDAELTPAQADAITAAVRQAAEQGDLVTVDTLDARLAALELRLIKWTVGTGIAVAGIVIAFLRLVG